MLGDLDGKITLGKIKNDLSFETILTMNSSISITSAITYK